ncbi:MAG: hypothetical protein Q8J64_08110, partial [Thermodesulfovibrionales bacterium]|nr:hypothetical protein [Thermodesulfovibrionales bacterium]
EEAGRRLVERGKVDKEGFRTSRNDTGKEEGGMEMLYKCFTFKAFPDMVSLKINHLAIPPPPPCFIKQGGCKVQQEKWIPSL